MKILFLLLAGLAVASAQFNFFNRRPQRPQRRPQSSQSSGGAVVHDRLGSTEYHYSWRVQPGSKFTGDQAEGYCRRLGGDWSGISISDNSVNNFVSKVLQGERLDYIWTSGRRSGRGWRWASGSFSPLNWSHTGGARRPQPDNREGNESCLAVLNNFYNDGVKWHDVACHHLKPIICQRG